MDEGCRDRDALSLENRLKALHARSIYYLLAPGFSELRSGSARRRQWIRFAAIFAT
jgi:hypothetical protein